jgi:hypothetical protein
MAILRFSITPSKPCICAIFKPTNLKFWILIYIQQQMTFVGFLISYLDLNGQVV